MVDQDMKTHTDVSGWVEFHIACVGACGRSVCDRKFVCLHLRVFETAIVILSTCSHVLSALLIITTTSVRLTRGTFSLSSSRQ